MKAPAQTWQDVDALLLDQINVADPKLYQDDVWPPYFARLRREAPVHYCPESAYGAYWGPTPTSCVGSRVAAGQDRDVIDG